MFTSKIKTLKTLALGVSVMFAAPQAWASCQFSFQVDDGKVYAESEYGEFIEHEMRKRLSRTKSMFNVHLTQTCDAKKSAVELNMESVALYIHSINGLDLADDVERYTNDDVTLDRKSLAQVFNNAVDFKSLSKKQMQDVVKYLAFVIAESARFEDVEEAVEKILTTSCSYQWEDYKNLVRRWKTMSVFMNSQGLNRGEQYIGGYRAFLIAPITSEAVNTYNDATMNGWEVVRYKYGERQKDKASPISIGSAVCPSN